MNTDRDDPGGAPLRLTPDRQEEICQAVRAGVRPEVAAVYAGVAARSYYRWMSLGRGANAEPVYVEFVEAVEVAVAAWEARDTLLIGEAAKSDWHAAAWRLERRLPAVYGKRERHEIANADNSSFRISAGPSFDPDKLTVAELEQLLALTEKASAAAAMAELTPALIRAALEQRREDERVVEEALRYSQSLRAFSRAAWLIIEPKTVFCPNWHIDTVCDHLEAVSLGEIDRLLINIPPRHMKTLLVSVFWPAWIWTRTPHTRLLTASYGANLAERHAIQSRDLLRSPWYRQHWPTLELKDDVNRTNRYENTQTGYRIATGVDGKATGEGGDVIIIDDPHKLEEAQSQAARNRVIEWHDGTLATRFNNPKAGVEVVVMQRLHQADLSGHLLERGDFSHLCLPARYEPSHPFLWPNDPRQQEGELLWPAHFRDRDLARIEQTLGSFRAAGQLQQRPAAPEGELLKRCWWQFYDPEWLHPDKVAMLPRFDRIVSSWDTAFEGGTTSDYVVGQVWGTKRADRYLLHSYRRHANLQATIEAMRAADNWARERWPHAGHTILVEKSANGHEIINALTHQLSGVTPITVTIDKVSRALAAAAPLEAGNIYLPGKRTDQAGGYHAPEWVESLIEEAALFPNGKHDDQVDALSQAINWAANHRNPIPMRTYVARQQIGDNLEALGLGGSHHDLTLERALHSHHNR